MSREPDIAARLRDIYATHPMVMEAAAELERLEAENARLKEIEIKYDQLISGAFI